MTDPVTIGTVSVSALTFAASALAKGGLGEVAKDAYKALKDAISRWAAPDVEALVKEPGSKGRQLTLTELIDQAPESTREALLPLANALTDALKADDHKFVGVEIDRLTTMSVAINDVHVDGGTGVHIREANVSGATVISGIHVAKAQGKAPR